MPELVGRTLLNRYRVDAFLGRGGMAEVYKAWDARRSVHIALKVLNEDLAEDYVFLRRFAREAQALELLQHPHIVRFFGFEESRGLAFLVMEYIDGVTLRRQLRLLERPLALPEALAVLEPVCSALHYAHGMGIYHCDVKPANIFIERGGRVVLGDFGIAQLSESATVTFSTPGTPAYMSPEQCRGEDLDARTDVYSLGITTYEILTLDRPFRGETEETTGGRGERVRWEQMNVPPPRPRRINPSIPSAAETAILRVLEKDPERRQQGALAFYRDLSGVGAVQPARSVPWVVESKALPPEPPQPPPSPPLEDRGEKARKSRPLLALGVGATAVGVVAVLICVAMLALLLSLGGGVEEPTVAPFTVLTSTLTEPLPSDTPPSTDTPPPPSTDTPTTPSTDTPTTPPTDTPTTPPTDTPTTPPAEKTPTAAPPGPPADAAAGEIWIRSADGMVMVYVPAGQFLMGSTDSELNNALQMCNATLGNCRRTWFEDEQPVRSVVLHGFWIDRTEVTAMQFVAFVQATGYRTTAELTGVGRIWVSTVGDWQEVSGANWQHPEGPGSSVQEAHPVVQVSWRDAIAYCTWVGGRLPTEAEWEYAARGPERRIYPWGNTFDGTYLNSCDINCPADWKDGRYDDGYAMTAPVGSNPFGASWCGALDMAGNVWEWVADRYGSYLDAVQVNPVGPVTGDGLVRGGGWGSMLSSFRTAQRHEHAPDLCDDDIGFRCVVVPGE